jgi:glycosyltransferase involved in cell wall biosynthesis
MKIALIGPTYPFRGGISHYTTLLYRHLKGRHRVAFFSFTRQYPKLLFPGKTDIDPSLRAIEEPGVERILDSMNPVTWLSVAWKIIKSGPNILVIPWWVSFWAPQFWVISFLVKIFSNTKVFFLCHNVVEHESNSVDKILTRVVLRNGDGFIVHSEEDKNNLLAMFPRAKVQKTFHPTYEVFDMGNIDANHVRKRLGIDGNIVLFFGFIRPYKGLKYLILALPEVLSLLEVTLLVVGEFWKDKEEYLHLIERLGIENNVAIIDQYVPNEEVQDYFSAADLVVQPYISATGSGIIQTAFAFNKPVVATEVGSLPEIIEDGKTGYLVPPEETKELARAIVTFFVERKSEEFAKNIEKAKYKFSWDRMVDCIEELSIDLRNC